MRNLKTEEEIIASWDDYPSKPTVSICCITYNHKPYIEDALKGFLRQETPFPFEILIHDDASNDGTLEIILEYKKKYPRIIHTVVQKENKYSQGTRFMGPNFLYPLAKGEYIALCEGDDYWTSPNKLKIQHDFMAGNPEYSFCFHEVEQIDNTENFSSYSAYRTVPNSTVEARDVILNHFTPTLSMFFRRELIPLNLSAYKKKITSGDIFLAILLVSKGKGFCFEEKMGVHRHHDGGVTKMDATYIDKRLTVKNYKDLYKELYKLVENKNKRNIRKISALRCEYVLFRLYRTEKKYFRAFLILIPLTIKYPFWAINIMKAKTNGYI